MECPKEALQCRPVCWSLHVPQRNALGLPVPIAYAPCEAYPPLTFWLPA
jgi:hypothetical protein